MSSSDRSRVAWSCPECSRTFRIPRSKPRPLLCPECAEKGNPSSVGQPAETAAAEDDNLHFQEATPQRTSSLKFGVVAQTFAKSSKDASTSAGHKTATDVGSSTSIDDLSERVDQILEHLENISRTMKLVRWVMWGLGLATVLSVVVTAGGLLYSMSMIGSLGSLLNQPADEMPVGEVPGVAAPGGARLQSDVRVPPQLQENMKQIEEYSNTVNELLKEVNR
ncbi:MAG: hypothetical protein O2983_16070 [Planctomycetota bacterium]|nr:hypothetical protein [Planctomycetota bacterium]MDA0918183.1 hypothetical protein [Planctomycetota bacterium]MDA1161120.1 hypothetical protein [Planctomycetota bacterium]